MCVRVSGCVSPSLTWTPPGLVFGDVLLALTLAIRAALGAGHTGRRAGGWAHRVGKPWLTREGTFKAAFCARAQTMTGIGATSRGLRVGSPRLIQTLPRPLVGLAALPRRSPPGGEPAWGPLLFTDLAIGREPRAALPGPGRHRASPQCREKLVHAVR